MSLSLHFPSLSEPLIDKGGKLTPIWQKFLRGIWERVVSTNLLTTNITTITTPGNTILPASHVYGGLLIVTAAQTANFTLTTDTAANILSAIPGTSKVGSGFIFRFLNSSTGTTASGTLAGGTGVTFCASPSNPTVAPGGWAEYLFLCTAIGSTPTFTVYPIAGGSAL